MRITGLLAALLASVGLVLVEFVYRQHLTRRTYHWLLLVGLGALPGLAVLSTATVFLAETKTVGPCTSCHVMHPFVHDMHNPESRTLAARPASEPLSWQVVSLESLLAEAINRLHHQRSLSDLLVHG